MSEKKIKIETLHPINCIELIYGEDYTIDYLIQRINAVKELYKDKELYVDINEKSNDNIEIDFFFYREETDEEYKKRLEKEKLHKAEVYERDYKTYLELKKKFDKKG